MLDARQGRRKLIYNVFKALYHKVPYLNALIKEARLLLPSLCRWGRKAGRRVVMGSSSHHSVPGFRTTETGGSQGPRVGGLAR